MIPAALQPAIVEILDAAGATLGTGFVVAPGVVMTAKHVVRTRPVAVRSHDGAATWTPTAIDDTAAADWAILTVAEAKTPIPCGAPPAKGTWFATGYANVRGNLRGTFSGDLRAQEGDVLDLFCKELQPLTYDDARGLSGAACIVDANAIGVIITVEHETAGAQKIVSGTVKALALPAALLPARKPWQELFEGAFRRCATEVLDAVVDSVQVPPVQAAGGVPHIVRFVIEGGVARVADAVYQAATSLGPDAAIVMDAACTLWVPTGVAETLCKAIANDNTVLIQSERDWVARHCVDRAYTQTSKGRSLLRTVVVEREEGDAIAAVEDALRGAMRRPAATAAAVRAFVKDGRTVVALSQPPDAKLAAEIRAALPGVRVAFLFAGATTDPNLTVLAPATAAREDDVLAENDAALARIGEER